MEFRGDRAADDGLRRVRSVCRPNVVPRGGAMIRPRCGRRSPKFRDFSSSPGVGYRVRSYDTCHSGRDRVACSKDRGRVMGRQLRLAVPVTRSGCPASRGTFEEELQMNMCPGRRSRTGLGEANTPTPCPVDRDCHSPSKLVFLFGSSRGERLV